MEASSAPAQPDPHPVLTSKLARLATADPNLYQSITTPKEGQK